MKLELESETTNSERPRPSGFGDRAIPSTRTALPAPKPAPSLDVEGLRKEIDAYFVDMRNFNSNNPADNLVFLSGYTARASQIRTYVVRMTEDRYMQNFRTKEIDPFLTECDRQFKIWSRLISANQLEWETSRGQK